ncbi:hypothetical protein LZ198_04150 [Myxococcus sp. K15C18031901]|uniref:hypothetical protein n=1 Tax=Myxococcus dinghuensis TaxID=2906761 RepID=UPI0020A6ED56|nr:hypothetical protein [Myxococcus dinghuensis]MCP3098066.1 hypothetical protein [Myxococcus dinghuensis]
MDTADERLAGLALSWLLTRGPQGDSRVELEAALRPLVEHRLSRAEWKTRAQGLVDALLAEGLVEARGRSRLALTEEGRARVQAFLQVEQLPRSLTWKKLKATHLLARGLGLPPSRAVLTRLSKADGVRTAVLRRQHPDVGTDELSLAQLRDRLLWRQLGVETERPFSLSAVQAHLLGQLLEADVKDPRRGLEQWVARAAGSTRVDAEAVRQTLLRGWLLPEATSAPVEERAAPTAPRTRPPPARVSVEDFAEHVLDVARALPTGRFGHDKVFISHVWRALQPEWPHREAFDAALLEANRTRHLSLTRADLVSAMDPTDVAESEVRSFGASFHFVVV